MPFFIEGCLSMIIAAAGQYRYNKHKKRLIVLVGKNGILGRKVSYFL